MHKAVIMARGLGTRMRKADDAADIDTDQAKIAETGVKALIPVDGDRPFLDYVLTGLADAGYTDVCLVIGPEHDAVREYYGQTVKPRRLNISFATQEKPLGTSDAVHAAEAFAGDDHVLVINSDNYYPVEALERLRKLDGHGLAGFERESMIAGSNIAAERVTKFAAIKVDNGTMTQILEKPSEEVLAALPEPICLSMNCWRFGPSIFKACAAIEPSPRGELEITDAVQMVIDDYKEPFEVISVNAPVLDMSSRGDIGPVAERLAGITVDF